MQLQNRSINIKNASKRMSNCSTCIFILTQLFGFEKNDNGEKLTLPDQVEIETLMELKNFLQHNNILSIFNDESSSYEMKMIEPNESFWPCNHCTYNNPIELNTCQMCSLPHNVCTKQREYSIINKEIFFFLYNICNKKTKQKKNHSLQADNDETKTMKLRRAVREIKNVSDETLQKLIRECAWQGLVEEFQLAMNDPRSSVEYMF